MSRANVTLQARRRDLDLLRLPLLGPLLRWRHARLVFQLPLLGVAALILYDGFTGPQLAPENFATTLAWVHYRGLLVLALLLVGNLFCMGCPFMLPRRLGKWLLRPTRRWPRALRNKWLPTGGLLVILWAYEAFGLWSSPWLTAWVAVAYFAAAMVIDGLFQDATFCKYVCPLGLFNFVYGTVSPAKIGAADPDVCRACVGKDCVNGGPRGNGCELRLFVPQMATSHDCTLCMDCVHACPHDNVVLAMRAPAARLVPQSGVWPFTPRADLACLFIIGLGAALMNALAMIGPGLSLEGIFGPAARPLTLVLLFGLGMVALPLGLAWLAAATGRRLGHVALTSRTLFARLAPAYIPLGFGVWAAHYGYHFLTGALTIVPIAQEFLGLHASWGMGQVLPTEWLYPVQSFLLEIGYLGSLVVGYRTAAAVTGPRGRAWRAALPVALLLTLCFAAALWIFSQPMQLRGTFSVGG